MQHKCCLQKGSLYDFMDGGTMASTLLYTGIVTTIFYRFLEITESNRQVKAFSSI